MKPKRAEIILKLFRRSPRVFRFPIGRNLIRLKQLQSNVNQICKQRTRNRSVGIRLRGTHRGVRERVI